MPATKRVRKRIGAVILELDVPHRNMLDGLVRRRQEETQERATVVGVLRLLIRQETKRKEKREKSAG